MLTCLVINQGVLAHITPSYLFVSYNLLKAEDKDLKEMIALEYQYSSTNYSTRTLFCGFRMENNGSIHLIENLNSVRKEVISKELLQRILQKRRVPFQIWLLKAFLMKVKLAFAIDLKIYHMS